MIGSSASRAKLLILNGCKFWPRLFVSLSVCLSIIQGIELDKYLNTLDVICLKKCVLTSTRHGLILYKFKASLPI